ncbi:MAG: hypothetical protein HQL63_02985 [Magnetococcales bacterium]|nr:hypothetical protein [Magnetococcales bacterium]MBF0321871.1 hypothetical protein [Magnetococcales bacterium]
MIRVQLQPEPAGFDKDVRQKGLADLRKKGIAVDQLPSKGSELAPFWRTSLGDLYKAYGGICAYLAIHFERVLGVASVDHFVAKSQHQARLAYEWDNYRLACQAMNNRKNKFDDVLDPFTVTNGWFQLELITGHIYPARDFDAQKTKQVEDTITRLKLNDPDIKRVRVQHFQDYFDQQFTSDHLKKISPFVWLEANRQGLLLGNQRSSSPQ